MRNNKTTECLDKLNTLYKQESVAINSFSCRKCDDTVPFDNRAKGAEAYIGRNYGDKPKIVFVSSDIGYDAAEGFGPTIESRRNVFDEVMKSEKALNPHLRGTLQTINALLGTNGNREGFSYCSLVNSAKCSVSKNEAPKAFFNNCFPILLQEIECLDPDVMVSQGNNALLAIKKFNTREINRKYFEDTGLSDKIAHIERFIRIIVLKSGKEVPVLTLVHPSVKNGKWKHFRDHDFADVLKLYRRIIRGQEKKALLYEMEDLSFDLTKDMVAELGYKCKRVRKRAEFLGLLETGEFSLATVSLPTVEIEDPTGLVKEIEQRGTGVRVVFHSSRLEPFLAIMKTPTNLRYICLEKPCAREEWVELTGKLVGL